MNTSLYNGIAGMKAHQNAIDLIADNVSNVNTPGYRSSTPEFSTVFSKQLAQLDQLSDPSSNDVGIGSIYSQSSINFSQGSLQDSDNQYNLAITGSGFFGVMDASGEIFYTRDGNFDVDVNGTLADPNGNYVMGISANNVKNGKIIKNPNTEIKAQKVGEQIPIKVPEELTYPPEPSTYVKLKGSLSPSIIKEVNDEGEVVQVPNIETFNADALDGEGNINNLNITFTKRVPQVGDSTTWDAQATITDKNGNTVSTKHGVLHFNGYGALLSNTLTSIDNNGTTIDIDMGSTYKDGVANSGYDGMKSIVNVEGKDIKIDGVKEGKLQGYAVDNNGMLIASFSNGRSVPIAKVSIYHFRNEAGLERAGNSLFRPGANSGKPTFFTDKNGDFVDPSQILSAKIENSNVDLTTALTELIAMQKAFDASSKSITTSDQLIQNAINMKK